MMVSKCTFNVSCAGYIESGGLHGWKEADSSGSEASKQDDESPGVDHRSNASGVHFIVGGEV